MVKQKRRLLFGALDRHEAHRRSPHSLANRFRIGGVVLLALHVRLYKLRRHQSNIMPVCGELSSPVVWQASISPSPDRSPRTIATRPSVTAFAYKNLTPLV
jgi:hypothetical protein